MKHTPRTQLEKKLAGEIAFHRAVARWVSHDLKSAIATTEMASEVMKSDIQKISEAQVVLAEAKNHLPENLQREITKKISEPLVELYNILRIAQSANRRTMDIAGIFTYSEDVKTHVSSKKQEFGYISKLIELFEFYQHRIAGKTLALRFSYNPEEKQRKITTNPGVFASIIANLVDNAVKYSVKYTTVDVSATSHNNHLVIESENYIPRRMSESDIGFIQGERNMLESDREGFNFASQGLGLYLIGKIVKEGYGGKIRILSETKKRINEKRTQSYERVIYPKGIQPYSEPGPQNSEDKNSGEEPALFYVGITLPLESLV